MISGALGTNCTYCHDVGIIKGTPERWKWFAADTNPNKETARKMILMVNAINKQNFGNQRLVTCYSCHQGLEDPPRVVADLAAQYLPPDETEPDAFNRQDPQSPFPEQVLGKYIQALGGTQRLDNLKTIVIKGTYMGYDTDFQAVPMDLYEKAPAMRTMVLHIPFGDRSEVFNGSAGWNATPDTSQVQKVLPMSGDHLASEKVMAQLAFPGQIRQVLTKWLTGPPLTISGAEPGAKDVPDRKVTVVQGLNASRLPVKLYFDQSGLLVRIVSYINTAIGLIPAQVDYTDFKVADGLKFPFHWVATWTDGQSVFNVTSVRTNVPIDDKVFEKPAPPKLLTPVMSAAKKQ